MDLKAEKMNDDTDFGEIGKKMPYNVPDGFFDRVSEQTLRKAKGRAEQHRKVVMLQRTVAIAASVVGLALLAWYFVPDGQPEKIQVVVQNSETGVAGSGEKPVQETINVEKPVPEPATATKPVSEPAVQNKPVEKPELQITEPASDESLSDLLAGLTDDELAQLAAQYKNDPFMEEASNN